jgi:hypothetical protein
MKKGVVWLSASLFLMMMSSISFSAVKNTLIDFNVYDSNIASVAEKDNVIHSNMVAKGKATDLSQYGYPEVTFAGDDWAISKWKITLASSANTVRNNVLSYTMKVPSKKFGDVLGARIHFIEGRFLSWAVVSPPFNFYPYYDDGSDVNVNANKEENSLIMGILMNVGQIKSVSSWIYGLNYQMQVGVRIRDRNDSIMDYFMGSVFYDGWRKLVWTNPEYTENVQDRVIQRIALYPRSYPYIAFDSYVVYKPEVEHGGDFVIYFKDVDIEYDRAIIREELDIDDEAAWGILAAERLQKRVEDLRTIGEKIYLYKQEMRRQQSATEQNAPKTGTTTPAATTTTTTPAATTSTNK